MFEARAIGLYSVVSKQRKHKEQALKCRVPQGERLLQFAHILQAT